MMQTKNRLNDLESDLEVTQKLFNKTRSWSVKKALNKLRLVLIIEKNLLSHSNGDGY